MLELIAKYRTTRGKYERLRLIFKIVEQYFIEKNIPYTSLIYLSTCRKLALLLLGIEEKSFDKMMGRGKIRYYKKSEMIANEIKEMLKPAIGKAFQFFEY